MDGLGDFGTYLWVRLPLLLLFAGGYLLYQLLAVTRMTDLFVTWALRRSRGSVPALLFYLIASAAVLSAFIPNAITVLAMLPVLKRLDADFNRQGIQGMTTVLMCSAIYGASIGGMGSMIGSPANAILFGVLDVFSVPGRMQISFVNWFIWSAPLVCMLVLAAWCVTAWIGLPRTARQTSITVACLENACAVSRRQQYGGLVFLFYMVFWVSEALFRQRVPEFAMISPVVSSLFMILFLYLIFIRVAPQSEAVSGPLLRPRDLARDIPKRGLMFLGLLVLLFVFVRWLGLDKQGIALAEQFLHGQMSPVQLFFALVLAVIFMTEFLSNTAVVAAFFPVAFYVAQGHGLPPLYLMMGVSVASTCAFMTPVATPTNALAFGEMKGASLTRMFSLGILLNIAGALIITGWLSWVLPRVYPV